jgi:4-amino-4-deoxy-L-arabinose transferase-like glycosyltransferase
MSDGGPGGRAPLPWSARAALLLLGAAALLLPALGAAPLERAEVYFVDAARAMVERGDYLVPYYRGQPFFDKPPLTYWLMAAAFHPLGFTTTAARLVPAGAALLVLAATLWLGRMLLGREAALLGGLALATTGAFMAFGRIAMSDMLLALWTTLAMALAVKALESGRAWPWVPLLGAALGLGFLTKGPVAVLLPGLGLAVAAWSRRDRRLPLTLASVAAAGLAFALCGLTWFALLWTRLGTEPLRWFFLRENLARFAGDTYDTGRAPWYYVVTYLAEGLPWSLLLPIAAWSTARSREPWRRGALVLLLWALAMAVPLSLSRGKLDYYLLPLYPPLSLAVGAFLARAHWSWPQSTWARGVAAVCAAVLAALPLLAGRFPVEWLPSRGPALAVAAVAPLGALACALAALRPRPAVVTGTLAAVAASVFLAAAVVLVPAFAAAQPHEEVVADVERERNYRADAVVIVCGDEARVQRDVLFHARVPVQEQCDLWAAAASRHPFLLLLRSPERASLQALEGLREVATYRYLPATALTLRGLSQGVAPQELSLMANFATSDPVAETKRKRDRKRALRLLAAAEASPP